MEAHYIKSGGAEQGRIRPAWSGMIPGPDVRPAGGWGRVAERGEARVVGGPMEGEERRRRLPAVGRIVGLVAAGTAPRWAVVEAARGCVDRLRVRLEAGEDVPALGDIVAEVAREAARLARPSLRPVVNATGIVVHTNLGRAPLSPAAVEAITRVAGRYNTLEYDVARGARGSRHDHAEPALRRLTGAEAALVVNNNAAAVFLCLTALASGREVLVSRGELVEIGGSFRVPDILAAGGARLVEVGTTNRTRLSDYERAVTPQTGLILKVHPSNFRIAGFTEAPSREALVDLGRRVGVPVMEDLGSGSLLTGALPAGHPALGEPDVRAVVERGLDLVTFSGDKLLGGPQAGIIVGKAAALARMRKHPLVRALRVDKLTLAALEATLAAYLAGEADTLPVPHALGRSEASLAADAAALRAQLQALPGAEALHVEVERAEAQAGGGSLPEVGLAGPVVALTPRRGSVSALEAALRGGDPPVITRITDGRLLIDPRTLLPDEAPLVVRAVAAALAGWG